MVKYNNFGVFFDDVYVSSQLKYDVFAMRFKEHQDTANGLDVKLRCEVPIEIAWRIRSILANQFNMPELKDLVLEAHKMVPGDYMNLHNDADEEGPFQVLMWFCKDHVGRQFLYGRGSELFEKEVYTGMVCFQDIIDPTTLHGVKMLTQGEVITITGYLKDN